MWTVVYLSQSKDMANKIKALLQKAGLLVKVRAITLAANDNFGCYEILVPESEVEEAHQQLINSIL